MGWLITLLLSGCALNTAEERGGSDEGAVEIEEASVQENESGEHSLRDDREKLKGIRSEIPEVVKKENDELALVLDLMKEYKRPSSDIRRRFDRVMRKRREKFNREMRKEREEFNKNERKKRDAYLESLKRRREAFKKKKVTREQSREFHKELSREREDTFNEAREKRREFESEFRIRRRDYEDEYRSVQRDFSERLRAYSKGYYDYHKNKRLQKTMERKSQQIELRRQREQFSGGQNMDQQALKELQEFEIIKTKPATTLQPEDE